MVINGKRIKLPIYLPDATRGVVRSLDSSDLKSSKIEGVVVNTYHLMNDPGDLVIKDLGGIGKFMNYNGFFVSDSGGFQLLSMIYRNHELGTISDKGVVFKLGKRNLFTPERSIEVQFNLGSDLIICLDDCPSGKASLEEVRKSVNRTIEWAKRCKEKYLSLLSLNERKPLLLAVIQGSHFKEERERCARALREIGFDAFGFGGWPIDEEGKVNLEIIKFTKEVMPPKSLKFALGIGNPQTIIEGFKAGYDIFDCVLPTRDARHERLYVFKDDPSSIDILNDLEAIKFLYINRERHLKDNNPISEFCDCHTCKNYSRGYLRHLFKIKDSLAWRLATIHNLRTYSKLMELLRNCGKQETLSD